MKLDQYLKWVKSFYLLSDGYFFMVYFDKVKRFLNESISKLDTYTLKAIFWVNYFLLYRICLTKIYNSNQELI